MLRFLLATSVAVLASGKSIPEFDDLEPCQGLFSWVDEPEPYKLELRQALIGEHRYRECQMVVLPSFRQEWAVYVVREEDEAPRIMLKCMKRPLWGELMDALSGHGTKSSYSVGSEAQRVAFQQIRIEVNSATAPLSDEAADVLERVWSTMLGRVRYPETRGGGEDGTTYHFSHWGRGNGFRSGSTWSPGSGTRTAALVRLAEAMRGIAEAPPPSRKELEQALIGEAKALVARLDVLSGAEQPR